MKIKRKVIVLLFVAIVGIGAAAAAILLLPKDTVGKLIGRLPIPTSTFIKDLIPALGQTPVVTSTVPATPAFAAPVVTVTLAAGQSPIHDGLSWFSTPTPTPAPVVGSVTIQAKSINLRAGPGTEYPVVGAAKQGDKLPVSGRNLQSTWFKVQTAAGEAWAYAQLVIIDVKIDTIPVVAVPPTPIPQEGK